jgi:hypothetical protein
MLRIGRLTVLGALSFCWLLACGDKINPNGPYDYGTGGTAGTPAGGADGGEASEAGAQGGAGGSTTPAVSYTNDIAPLFKKGCLCHVQGAYPPLLDTYSNAKRNAAASLQSMIDGSMPPGSAASKADKDLLQAWISAGSPNN